MMLREMIGGRKISWAKMRRIHAEAFEDLRDSGWVMIGPSTVTRSNVKVALSGADPMKIVAGFRSVDGSVYDVCERIWYDDDVDPDDTATRAVSWMARLARFAFLVHAELVRRGIMVKIVPEINGTRFMMARSGQDGAAPPWEYGYLFLYSNTGELGVTVPEKGGIQTDDPSDAADWLTQDLPSVT